MQFNELDRKEEEEQVEDECESASWAANWTSFGKSDTREEFIPLIW